ncbi:CRISPR-associated protein Csm2 [Caldanaerovirga acetigignens]|uniref:CRISPR system Cms protein Csm2 n=1 Tax=Caldanaerovirga acetigignens TaxID=447595 RepID=A0A1M7M7T4_9FIRM|nr:type III-A CRISPR-associated protein Csm2 [Caldanaerovirga acetigignens]SHM86321.1 CRISPR-associated protein Csm2 [Caldanaerovirga acetigignens]
MQDNHKNNKWNQEGQDVNLLLDYVLKNIEIAINKEKDKRGDVFIKCAENFGEVLKLKKVSYSMIRRVYNEAKRISREKFCDETIYKLKVLKSLIAYTEGRFNELRKVKFSEVLSRAINEAEKNEDNYRRFFDFFQAVIAYHRAKGGKE